MDPGPLLRARCGPSPSACEPASTLGAAIAAARKIACLCGQLLTKEEDHAVGRPSLVRAKLRQAELNSGAARLPNRHGGRRVSTTPKEREAERELVERAEAAYRRFIDDWRSTGPKGAGATNGRAPSTRQAAQQAKAQSLRFSSSSTRARPDYCKRRCKRQKST